MSGHALPITADLAGDALYKRVSWRLIPLLIVCFIVAYYDRVNISFAKLQMQSELKFSDTVYGLGASLFFVGYILCEIPSNVILHRIGARKWIARIMISWGIASSLMMFVATRLQFYAMRFIVGAMEAGFLPGVVLYFTYWFPQHRRGRANSLFMTAISLAGVTGGPLAGWIMTGFAGANGWSGWQWLFLLEGIPAVVFGVVVMFCLDERPQAAKWLRDDEKRLIESDIAAAEQVAPAQHSLLRAFTDPRALFLSGTYFLILVGLGGVTFWMPQLIKNAGALGVMSGAIFVLLYAFPMFALLDTKNLVLVTLGLSLGYGLGFGGLASAQGAFLANLFPTRYRFSGIALTRELNSLLIAGPTPFIAAALVSAGGGKPVWVVTYLMVCCAITAIAVLAIRSRSYARGSE